MDVRDFSDLADKFKEITERIVWCTVATVDLQPVGYDPTRFWSAASDDGFGVLKLTPWRLEVWSLAAMAKGQPAEVWRPQPR